ncbi:unnamed protein product, partial [Heterotrigona itama]
RSRRSSRPCPPPPTIESMLKPIFGFEGTGTIGVGASGIIVRLSYAWLMDWPLLQHARAPVSTVVRVITGSRRSPQQTRAASSRDHPASSPSTEKRHHCDAKLMLRNTEAFSSHGRHTLLTSPGDRASPSMLQPAAHEIYSGRKEHWALGCPGEKKKNINYGPNERISRAPADHGLSDGCFWHESLLAKRGALGWWWGDYATAVFHPYHPAFSHTVGVKNQPKLGGTSRYDSHARRIPASTRLDRSS